MTTPRTPLGVGVDDATALTPRLDLCPVEDKKVQSALPLKAPVQEECRVHEDDDDDEHFFRSIAEEPDENMENFHEGGETKQTTNNKQQHTPPPPPPQTSPRRKNSTNNNSTNSNSASTSSGSNYRGVTAPHRMSGRWKSDVWENGTHVYLGTFESEEHAARAHDRMAIHLKMHQQTVSSTSDHDASEDAGVNDLAKNTDVPALNFPIADYADELHSLRSSSREDLVARLRRESSGFSWGTSTYRGVSYRESTNRWVARIGRLLGRKYSYLGTFATGEAAARAYDRAAIVCRGRDAITNFHLSEYEEELAKVEAATPEERTEMERAIVSRTEVGDALCQRKRVDGVAETAKGLAAAEPPAAAAATAALASASDVVTRRFCQKRKVEKMEEVVGGKAGAGAGAGARATVRLADEVTSWNHALKDCSSSTIVLIRALSPMLHACSPVARDATGTRSHASRPTWAGIAQLLNKTKEEEDHPDSARGRREQAMFDWFRTVPTLAPLNNTHLTALARLTLTSAFTNVKEDGTEERVDISEEFKAAVGKYKVYARGMCGMQRTRMWMHLHKSTWREAVQYELEFCASVALPMEARDNAQQCTVFGTTQGDPLFISEREKNESFYSWMKRIHLTVCARDDVLGEVASLLKDHTKFRSAATGAQASVGWCAITFECDKRPTVDDIKAMRLKHREKKDVPPPPPPPEDEEAVLTFCACLDDDDEEEEEEENMTPVERDDLHWILYHTELGVWNFL